MVSCGGCYCCSLDALCCLLRDRDRYVCQAHLKAQLRSRTGDLSVARAQLATAEAMKQSGTGAPVLPSAGDAAALQSQLQHAKEDAARLAAEVNELRTANHRLRQAETVFLADTAELREQLEDLRQRHADLQRTHRELRVSSADVVPREQLDALQRAADEAQLEAAEYRSENTKVGCRAQTLLVHSIVHAHVCSGLMVPFSWCFVCVYVWCRRGRADPRACEYVGRCADGARGHHKGGRGRGGARETGPGTATTPGSARCWQRAG